MLIVQAAMAPTKFHFCARPKCGSAFGRSKQSLSTNGHSRGDGRVSNRDQPVDRAQLVGCPYGCVEQRRGADDNGDTSGARDRHVEPVEVI